MYHQISVLQYLPLTWILGTVPEFSATLYVNKSTVASGQNVTIKNCVYNAPYGLPSSGWWKDGTLYRQATTTRRRNRRSILDSYPNIPAYRVSDLHFTDLKLTDEGLYQCVIKDEANKEFKSRTVELKLIGRSLLNRLQ